jgi:sec-independent protein translocase protein TatC
MGEKNSEEAKMTFLEHLGEFRRRAIFSLLAIVICTGICYGFREFIFRWLKKPLGNTYTLHFFTPHEGIMVYLKVSFFAGLFLASPIVFYQAWAFVLPALKIKEKKIALRGFFTSILLFITGVLLAYFYLLPFGIKFLLRYATGMTPILSATKYFSFLLIFLLTFGVIFQLPLIMLFLTTTGIISPVFFRKRRREVILGCMIAAAIITPSTDILNMLIVAIPLILLYEIGIICSAVANLRRQKKWEVE